MTQKNIHDLSKADVERFLYAKHLTSCPVCSRFRSRSDIDVHTISCERCESSSAGRNAPINVLMIVCQNCGAIQFHDREIIAHWLDCQVHNAFART
jgi:hypothetical protein